MTTLEAFIQREGSSQFSKGWGRKLYESQFSRYDGESLDRIKCGDETGMRHLTPGEGQLCHDCGAAIGEYHVPGCDSEECPACHGQAFCCDCNYIE
jgi:hypothetical protein